MQVPSISFLDDDCTFFNFQIRVSDVSSSHNGLKFNNRPFIQLQHAHERMDSKFDNRSFYECSDLHHLQDLFECFPDFVSFPILLNNQSLFVLYDRPALQKYTFNNGLAGFFFLEFLHL